MPEHGKENTYIRHRCRCEECVEAMRAALRRRRNRKKAVPETAHGTLNGYTYYRCRCAKCLKAYKDYHLPYMREYRAKRKDELLARQKEYRARVKAQQLAKEEARRARYRKELGDPISA